MELARKSTPRLEAIVALHARWRQGGHSGGVIYVCADENVCERVRSIGAARGLGIEKGGGLRVLTLAEVHREAIDVWTTRTHRHSLVSAPQRPWAPGTTSSGRIHRPDPSQGLRRA